jgi:hypothetical protein
LLVATVLLSSSISPKSQQTARRYGVAPAHVFTTSYMTDAPLRHAQLTAQSQGRPWGYSGDVLLSHGKTVGLRFVPMTRDLRFAWEETPHQLLDEQARKMRQSVHAALIGWARTQGEGADYTDNLPQQCMHPVGHWFEVPNMLRNGTLAQLLQKTPNLRYLMVHNIDTLGATLDPAMLGLHIASQKSFSFEVTARRIDDRGGGLARVDDQVRLVEGLAMPRITDEFGLRFYNTLTNWIDIDGMLTLLWVNAAMISCNTQSGSIRQCELWRRVCRPMSPSKMSKNAGATGEKTFTRWHSSKNRGGI